MAKIFCAEDDLELAELLTSFLSMHNYTVEHADNGNKALEYLRTYGFDAAILDWELPGLSGVEICQQLRKEGNKLPILMLTGRGSSHDTVNGIDAGADDYLVKPIDPIVVIAKLKALLRRTEERTDNLLRINGLELNPESRTLTRQAQAIALLPKEFSLLEFMMRNPERVFSADELINHVWSADEAVSIESVRSCVFRLRKKVNIEGQADVIENIYGVGYVLRKG